MPQRLPIKAAHDIGTQYDCRQVILLAWDGKLTHIVTWGKTVEDCAHAADGGNRLKLMWGWPECNDQPSRVRKLERRIKELEAEVVRARSRAIPPGMDQPQGKDV